MSARLPPRLLVLLYFGYAHLCLALAMLALAVHAGPLSGFFYQARMLAVVHFVTLGWISSSILGALYLIAPMALRSVLAAGRLDYVAFALWVTGSSGIASHFWLDEYSGMVWSAVTLLAVLIFVGLRVLGILRRAPIPRPIKLHFALAFLNVTLAGLLGMLIGLEKQLVHVLPGYLLHSVYAHAHLAALGWATMMVMGAGYRLFPMILPAAMPEGGSLYVGAVLVEAGVLGLVVALPAGSGWTGVFVVLAAAGVAAFLSHVVWMARHCRQAPRALIRPDLGTGHAAMALISLVVATGLGLVLALAPAGAWKLDLAVAYGVVGLLGFLSQLVVGVASRLLPTHAWMHAMAQSGFAAAAAVSPYAVQDRRLQAGGLALWVVGVPWLAVALATHRAAWVAGAAWVLVAAVVLNGVNLARIARHAFGR